MTNTACFKFVFAAFCVYIFIIDLYDDLRTLVDLNKHVRSFNICLNFIFFRGLKFSHWLALKSLKFDLLKPADTLQYYF